MNQPLQEISQYLFFFFFFSCCFFFFLLTMCVCSFPLWSHTAGASLTIKSHQLPNPRFEDCKIDEILRGALSQSMWNLKAKADGVQEKDSLMMMILMIKWKSNQGPLNGGVSWKAFRGSHKERKGEFQKFSVNQPSFLKQ